MDGFKITYPEYVNQKHQQKYHCNKNMTETKKKVNNEIIDMKQKMRKQHRIS